MIKSRKNRQELLRSLSKNKLNDYFKIMSQLAVKHKEKYMKTYFEDMKFYYNQLGGKDILSGGSSDTLLGQLKKGAIPRGNKKILIVPDTIFGHFQAAISPGKAYRKANADEIKRLILNGATKNNTPFESKVPGDDGARNEGESNVNEGTVDEEKSDNQSGKDNDNNKKDNADNEVINIPDNNDNLYYGSLKNKNKYALPYYMCNTSKQIIFGFDKGKEKEYESIINAKRDALLFEFKSKNNYNDFETDNIPNVTPIIFADKSDNDNWSSIVTNLAIMRDNTGSTNNDNFYSKLNGSITSDQKCLAIYIKLDDNHYLFVDIPNIDKTDKISKNIESKIKLCLGMLENINSIKYVDNDYIKIDNIKDIIDGINDITVSTESGTNVLNIVPNDPTKYFSLDANNNIPYLLWPCTYTKNLMRIMYTNNTVGEYSDTIVDSNKYSNINLLFTFVPFDNSKDETNVDNTDYYTDNILLNTNKKKIAYMNGTNNTYTSGGGGLNAAMTELFGIKLWNDSTKLTLIAEPVNNDPNNSNQYKVATNVFNLLDNDQQRWKNTSNDKINNKPAGTVFFAELNSYNTNNIVPSNLNLTTSGVYQINGYNFKNNNNNTNEQSIADESVKEYYKLILDDFISKNNTNDANILQLSQVPGKLYGGTDVTLNAICDAVKNKLKRNISSSVGGGIVYDSKNNNHVFNGGSIEDKKLIKYLNNLAKLAHNDHKYSDLFISSVRKTFLKGGDGNGSCKNSNNFSECWLANAIDNKSPVKIEMLEEINEYNDSKSNFQNAFLKSYYPEFLKKAINKYEPHHHDEKED